MPTLWETRFNNHALWQVVEQMDEQLAYRPKPSDVDLADSLARLQWLVAILKEHRDTEDVRGYTPTMLENVQRALAGNVQPPLNQYLAEPEAQQASLRAAAEAVDTVLDVMGPWPQLPARGAAQAAGRSYAQFAAASNAALEELTHQRDKLKSELAEMEETIASERAAFKQLRTSFEQDSESEIETKLQEVSDRYLDEVRASIEKINSSVASADKQKARLDGLTAQSNNLVAAIGRKAVASDYRTNARNKSVAGWVWDILGLAVAAVPLFFLLQYLFDDAAISQSTTALAITRVGISIAAVGLAALCFRRGSSNHKESRRAKRADIRVSTVHPFIANQPAEVQEAVLEGMADRIYLQGLLEDESGDHDEELMRRLLQRVRDRRQPPGDEPA